MGLTIKTSEACRLARPFARAVFVEKVTPFWQKSLTLNRNEPKRRLLSLGDLDGTAYNSKNASRKETIDDYRSTSRSMLGE